MTRPLLRLFCIVTLTGLVMSSGGQPLAARTALQPAPVQVPAPAASPQASPSAAPSTAAVPHPNGSCGSSSPVWDKRTDKCAP
jgi:hypothetical protein